MKRTIVIFTILVFSLAASGQANKSHADTLYNTGYLLKTATFDGQTYPYVELKEIVVTARAPRNVKFNYRRHARMVYNIRRVYPYSVLVRNELARINRLLETMDSEKDKRNFLSQYEKDLFKTYEGDLRQMTFTQGKILIKLIDRETQNTSYDLIRDYRGGFSATFWQGIARIFGSNLKSTYDPTGEDYLIEQIVREIEAGRL